MRVVDLADEFGLTTAETIDACLWAGVAADGAAAELTIDEVARVREHMTSWNEAGFAPWHGDPSDSTLAAAPTTNATATARRAASGPDLAAEDGDDAFSSRADRLRRREPAGEGLAAVARESATRKGTDRPGPPVAAPVERIGPATGPAAVPSPGGVAPAAASALPNRAAEKVGSPAPAPDPRPAPPTARHEVAESTMAPIAAGVATLTAGAPAEARVADASEAPDDDFGPSGPGTEVVGPEPVKTLSPVLPPAQGGPTGWLPGGPKAKAHLAPLAVVALALAIASLAIPFVPAVVAIVLASITKDRIDRSRGWLKGKPVATLAQVVAGIGVGLWLVLIIGSILVSNRNNASQLPDLQVDQGPVAYSDIQTGECVRLPRIGAMNLWSRVDCAEPHQAEVFGSLLAGNPKAQNYPGDAPIEATAREGCRAKLADYAGTTVDSARLEVGYSYPSAFTWKNDNDRTIHCLTFRKDGALLVDTVKVPSTIPDAKAGN